MESSLQLRAWTCHSVLQLSLVAEVQGALRYALWDSALRLPTYQHIHVGRHPWSLEHARLFRYIVRMVCGMDLAQAEQHSLK